MKAYLGLGGNVGDTRAYMKTALGKLAELGSVEAISSFYETEPVGFSAQGWFLNRAVILETELPPELLLLELKKIEHELDRTANVKNGPREIDIDILLYDHVILKTETLTIPHPRLQERAFALVPLAEVAPELVHPVLKKTILKLFLELRSPHVYRKILPEKSNHI